MRYIDISKLETELPTEWHDEAQKALDELRKLPPEERGQFIDKKGRIWRTAKYWLKKHSQGKCWYCESKQIRSHMDVDHFRPKKRVEECEEHPGYWWLAFDWRNYRLSCVLCNRPNNDDFKKKRGKHDHFPLDHGAMWCTDETQDLNTEIILLLDPINEDDPGLLQFLPGGLIEPRNRDRTSQEYSRAKTSIKIYHLDEPELIDARSKHYDFIMGLIKDFNGFSRAALNASDPEDQTFLLGKVDETLELLYDSVSASAQYSAVAIEILRSSGQVWAVEILEE